MAKYSYVKAINLSLLTAELATAKMNTLVDSISTEGTVLNINTNKELSPWEQMRLRSIIVKHNPITPIVENRIISAMDFGRQLQISFATRNVMAGLNEQQILQLILQLKEVQNLLLTGSLKTALMAMQQLKPSAALPQSLIDEFIQKIKVYLGVA